MERKLLIVSLILLILFGLSAFAEQEIDLGSTDAIQFNSLMLQKTYVEKGVEGTYDLIVPDSTLCRGVYIGSDVNQNGLYEIILTSYSNGGTIHLFEVSGDNTVSEIWTSPSLGSSVEYTPRDVKVGDLDNNGDYEIIVPVNGTGGIDDAVMGLQIFEYTKSTESFDAVFHSIVDPNATSDRFLIEGIFVADVDQDGKEEVLIGNNGNGDFDNCYIVSFSGTFDGGDAAAVIEYRYGKIDTPGINGIPYPSIVGDLDGDGNLEVLCAVWDNAAVLIIEATGADTYEYRNYVQTDIWLSDAVPLHHGMDVADLDGNGKDEVYVTLYSLGAGAGALMGVQCTGELTDMTTENSVFMVADAGESGGYGLTIGDIDNNGKTDIYTSAYKYGKVISHEFQGGDITQTLNYTATTFAEHSSANGSCAIMASQVDIDGDGAKELAVAYLEGGASGTIGASIYENVLEYTTIYDIQYNETVPGEGDDCYPSTMIDSLVKIQGTVTGVDNYGVYIQNASGAWNGIYLYMPGFDKESFSISDSVLGCGTISEYFGLTEITDVFGGVTLQEDVGAILPVDVSTGTLGNGCDPTAEAYEGILVRLTDVTVTAEANESGVWYVDDGTGPCSVDDMMLNYYPSVGKHFDTLIGCVRYSWGEYRVNPRFGADIEPIGAYFSATPTSGNAPLTVNFTDLSIGNPTSWEWDFENDGTVDATEQNPEWTYTEPGTYTVSLTVSDGTDTDTKIKTDYISVITAGASYALQFDGTDDFAIIADFPYPAEDLTIQAWIKPDQFDEIREIIYGINPDNYSTIQFRLEEDGRLLYGENPNWTYVATPDPCVNLNEWNHVSVTRENSICKIYVNGVQLAESVVNEDVAITILNFGGRANIGGRMFSGLIDDVRIWNRALSDTELQDGMYQTLNGNESGLLGYWRMDEGSGQLLTDITANGYDGILGYEPDADPHDPAWIATNWPYEIPSRTVTFQADMTQLLQDGFDPNINALELRGSFNSWSSGDTLLPDAVNESIYVITKEIAGTTGDLIEWKFKASPDAYFANHGWEIGSNRNFAIPTTDTVLAPVAPNIIYVMPISQDVTVTFSVNMTDAVSYQTGEPFENLQSVFLNGGFCCESGWCGWTLDDTTNLIRLYDDGTNGGDVTADDSVWTTEVLFATGSGRIQSYKYGAYDPNNMDLQNPAPMDNEAGWGNDHTVTIDDSSPLYVPPTDTWATTGEVVIPISEARGMADGEVVTICGIVTSPNFLTPGHDTQHTIQDATAGITIWSGAFDADLSIGDNISVTGELVSYYGKKEIVPNSVTDISVHSSGNTLPAAQTLTISQILSSPESYESEIIRINDVAITDGLWPSSGNDANLTITDNPGDSLIMRIDKETDVDEGTEPTGSFDVQGVISQFDSSEPYNSGYQILPRFYSDIITGEGPELSHFQLVYAGNPYLAMNVYVTGATLDGVSLSVGDEIGIFDGDYCVGAGIVIGAIDPYLALVASTDDPGTTEIDGFTPGHEITYRLWDSGEELEVSNVATTYTMGDGTFSSQGTAMVSLEGLMTVEQDISLNTGWNIMSFYSEPEDMNLQSIVQPLIDNSSLLKIQDETGAAIEELPVIGWINNIGDMSVSEGYYIKVNSNQVLALEGNPVDLPIDIGLDAGWNIMGYPVASAQGAMSALQPLIDAGDLLKVQDETGAAIEELPVIGWVNNIGDFEPDEGYYVKVSSSTSISLDEPSKLSRVAIVSESENIPTHFVTSFEGNPYLAMNIYVLEAALDDIAVKEGTEIGVFYRELCVGTAPLTRSLESNDSYLSIIVSTDDPLTEEVDGFVTGSSVSFRLWDGKDEYAMSATTCSDDEDLKALRFESQGTIVVKLTGKTLPKEYRLYACYPNPFNPTTTIRYDLPNDSHVKLVVYDLQGRLIRTLISEQKEAGYQSVIWNGKNDNGRMLPSGMYFYQLSAGNFSQVKKMALVK